jgi:hypothetical protein
MAATATVESQRARTNTRDGRIGAIAGVAFALLFFLGVVMLEIPESATDQELTAWWSDGGNQLTAVVSMYVFVLAGLCFLVFLVRLRSHLLTPEGEPGGGTGAYANARGTLVSKAGANGSTDTLTLAG